MEFFWSFFDFFQTEWRAARDRERGVEKSINKRNQCVFAFCVHETINEKKRGRGRSSDGLGEEHAPRLPHHHRFG